MGILGQATEAYLCKTEHPLDHCKDMLHLGPDFRLGAVAHLGRLIQWLVASAFLVSEILRARCRLAYCLGLSSVGRIVPYTRFAPVQQVFQHLRIMDVGRRSHHRVNLFDLADHYTGANIKERELMRFHISLSLILAMFFAHLAKAEVLDLSEMDPDDTLAVRTFGEYSGLTSGVFASTVPKGIVEVNGNFVMTTGAGIYFGTENAWTPPGSCFFYVEKADSGNGGTYRALLPVKVTNEGVWHKSIVEESVIQIDTTGNKGRYSSAKPISGGIKGLEIMTPSMTKPIEVLIGGKGQIKEGHVALESIGNVAVHFTSLLNATGCYIELNETALNSLLDLVPKKDHEAILNLAR